MPVCETSLPITLVCDANIYQTHVCERLVTASEIHVTVNEIHVTASEIYVTVSEIYVTVSEIYVTGDAVLESTIVAVHAHGAAVSLFEQCEHTLLAEHRGIGSYCSSNC